MKTFLIKNIKKEWTPGIRIILNDNWEDEEEGYFFNSNFEKFCNYFGNQEIELQDAGDGEFFFTEKIDKEKFINFESKVKGHFNFFYYEYLENCRKNGFIPISKKIFITNHLRDCDIYVDGYIEKGDL